MIFDIQKIAAKKRLGQHFLIDQNIAKKIVTSLSSNSDLIIEIGPGMGVLTQYLLDKSNFIAFDIDEESIKYLQAKYVEHARKFILTDFIKTDLTQYLKPYTSIIGNFPYNISSQILFKIVEHKNSICMMVGMFQKEVAQRVAEKEGSKIYGILSILVQSYYDIEYLFTVNENVFNPPPKVKSGVIRMTRNSTRQLNCDEVLFVKVVKTSFNQRRKTIRNSLKSLVNTKEISHEFLDKRPEQLSIKQFEELTRIVGEKIINV